ncbi:tRNA methyltransferase complex GCD14 subunit [Basidiobolus meristosporus CBS 931.73]|uniref:tRNA (adenine(58)-N(1))-methyltransferase catalytic subunit TRM61 n=1 Tax=Basidiobolus meristosporus CBS 931.73 TaxID=1314790 RepID=A0A1Y1YFD3_9FUNG|nr:tRNA methyltransferase complex GCD14 subunit [Basidiobolus meristosporus CBS 931.73]|eukprot:ORX96613.1 tRNA methyltransferase complex GCD14 subunit [Basidiobolus meristosporus CBS 931.73]
MFAGYKKYIEHGDLVVAYMSRDSMVPLMIDQNETYNNKFGSFKHKDIIGKEYGSKVVSHTGKGFMYILHPTPELWTLVLPHRTAILYQADISYITTLLDIKPGSKVIESGTGSGSFSHSLIRNVAPTGHLYTFEYHQERATVAAQEFKDHGISDLVTIECRDVCKTGFGLKDLVHAVFLDLPAPWEAVPFAKEAFKQNRLGRICCFSPCIEQVQRTCMALSEHGFAEIKMYEVLMKNHEVRTMSAPTVADAIASTKLILSKKRKSREESQKLEEAANANEAEEVPTLREIPTMTVSKPAAEVRGHTSYLTFATFIPVHENL